MNRANRSIWNLRDHDIIHDWMWAPILVGLSAARLLSICPLVLVCRCPDSYSTALGLGAWDGYLKLRRSFGLARDGYGGGVAFVFPVVLDWRVSLLFWGLG